MTKSKPFREVSEKLQQTLTKKAEKNGMNSSTLRDFDVMSDLGFSPQAWSRWRPKLVEACQVEESKDEGYFSPDGFIFERKRGHIEFVKKLKTWRYEVLPLRKRLRDSEEWTELTEEDFKKIQCEQ